MKRITIALIASLVVFIAFCQESGRQRNTVYVFDCTKSMAGHNGAPNIWDQTKNFLKSELEKEAQENPNALVTVLPFQDRVHHPIKVDLRNINWPNINNVLDQYVQNITGTNICDSWLTAEKYVDPACDNYIVLLTDGQDNVNSQGRLSTILREFCGKFRNTKGFYVELTKGATLPEGVQSAIDLCQDLYNIDASAGIPSFGCSSEDVIHINTRDLPIDIPLGFSNSGIFSASLANDSNPYVSFSVKGGKIQKGKMILHVESKHGENIETLNKIMGGQTVDLSVTVESPDVIITNPDLDVVLHNTPLRTLDTTSDENGAISSSVDRVKPFLWIKGNPIDTLRWDLNPKFNEAAHRDGSVALFKVKADRDLSAATMLYNGSPIGNDSTIAIQSNEPAVIELLVSQQDEDNTIDLTLVEIDSYNLDRFNGVRPKGATVSLSGEYKTSMSLVEILLWVLLGVIALLLILWFAVIRNQKYPKFSRGIINIQSPYYASIRVKGYRMVVIGPKANPQGWFDRLWRGKILYHVNPLWPCLIEITPSGKNMRFRCPSGELISDPTPIWTRNCEYKVFDPGAPSTKFDININ